MSGFIFGGAGGNRTHVQARTYRAFYMLSHSLVFDAGLMSDNPTST